MHLPIFRSGKGISQAWLKAIIENYSKVRTAATGFQSSAEASLCWLRTTQRSDDAKDPHCFRILFTAAPTKQRLTFNIMAGPWKRIACAQLAGVSNDDRALSSFSGSGGISVERCTMYR